VTVLLELLTALLEYLDFFNGILHFAGFLTDKFKALISSQNACIIPYSYTIIATYYARNYAGIIAASLVSGNPSIKCRLLIERNYTTPLYEKNQY